MAASSRGRVLEELVKLSRAANARIIRTVERYDANVDARCRRRFSGGESRGFGENKKWK